MTKHHFGCKICICINLHLKGRLFQIINLHDFKIDSIWSSCHKYSFGWLSAPHRSLWYQQITPPVKPLLPADLPFATPYRLSADAWTRTLDTNTKHMNEPKHKRIKIQINEPKHTWRKQNTQTNKQKDQIINDIIVKNYKLNQVFNWKV